MAKKKPKVTGKATFRAVKGGGASKADKKAAMRGTRKQIASLAGVSDG